MRTIRRAIFCQKKKLRHVQFGFGKRIVRTPYGTDAAQMQREHVQPTNPSFDMKDKKYLLIPFGLNYTKACANPQKLRKAKSLKGILGRTSV